ASRRSRRGGNRRSPPRGRRSPSRSRRGGGRDGAPRGRAGGCPRAAGGGRAPSDRDRSAGRASAGPRIRVEEPQQLELAFGGPPPGDRARQALLAAEDIAVALLQGDHGPADIGDDLPEAQPLRVDPPARLRLVAAVKVPAVRDPAGLAVEPGEAPAFAAEPGEVLVLVAPAGKLPVEDAGELRAVDEVVAGAEIAVAQHG